MGFVTRLLEHPAVYSAWQAPFAAEKFAPVERRLKRQRIRRVLEGRMRTRNHAGRFAGVDYVGIDINEAYLAVARAKYGGGSYRRTCRPPAT
jgi:hypothetical protein